MASGYARYNGIAGAGSAGVISLNGLSGALTLVAGTGISVTPSGSDITIASTGQPAGNYITALTGDGTASGPGSAALTLATVNANVGSFGSASSVATFTANAKGLVTAAASTAIQIAESQVTNLVSDLAGKQATGNYITALTGDGTASGPGSAALTLATVNANVGSFGSSTAIPSVTVNAKGQVTAASTSVVIAPAGTLTGTTLAATVVTSSLSAVGTITTGTWTGTTIAVLNGGTGVTTKTGTGNVVLSAAPTFSGIVTFAGSTVIDASGNIQGNAGFATKSYQSAAPSTGGTVNMSNNVPGLILIPAGTLATLTIAFPSAPIDGQRIFITTTQVVTAVTLTGTGINGAPTGLSPTTPVNFIWDNTAGGWLRV